MFSYLQDFKSLTDPELEKLIQRFALPWILPKAQMDDLIKKLRANGRGVIRVRGLGDHNIYELMSSSLSCQSFANIPKAEEL